MIQNDMLSPTPSVTEYYDTHFHQQAVKILPGEFYATSQHILLITLLGSCIAVCLRDRRSGVAGMNHFLLPQGNVDIDHGGNSGRYGVHAMELLVNNMLKLGAHKQYLEAKVFGAGKVLDGLSQMDIGGRNSEFIRQYLAMEGIPLIAEDVLGDCARKVYFFTYSGKVLVKKLQRASTPLVKAEMAYQKRIGSVEDVPCGDVELFLES